MTTTLIRATLTRLKQVPGKGKKGKPSFTPDPKGTYEVQFNPTTLKLTRSNNVDKGASTTNTQKRQVPSVQPATLTFDLEFDTAEGDGQGKPKDVRDLTRIVRQFTEPTREKPTEPPPAVRFDWGTFRFQGIVTQLTEDLDYFSPDGRPLRAKVSVTITEQNPEWEAGEVGPGARDARAAGGAAAATRPSSPGGAAVPAGVPGTGPGSSATPNPVSTALAQAGESVQQLLTRLDADPATWRSAMAGLDSPLSLTAGAQVQLGASVSASASASASASFGVGGGFTASAGVNDVAEARAALGFSGGASLGVGAFGEARAGFVLAESGGLGVASVRVQADAAASAQASARASFPVPAAGVTARADASASVSLPDPRALSYGRGVPLRARISW
ncbi:MAG TPA: hypothetical protein VGK17_00975 [Propionicimonas sp.]